MGVLTNRGRSKAISKSTIRKRKAVLMYCTQKPIYFLLNWSKPHSNDLFCSVKKAYLTLESFLWYKDKVIISKTNNTLIVR